MNRSKQSATTRTRLGGRLAKRTVMAAAGAGVVLALTGGSAFASVPHTDPVCSSGAPYDTSIAANPAGDGYWSFTDAAGGKGDGAARPRRVRPPSAPRSATPTA